MSVLIGFVLYEFSKARVVNNLIMYTVENTPLLRSLKRVFGRGLEESGIDRSTGSERARIQASMLRNHFETLYLKTI